MFVRKNLSKFEHLEDLAITFTRNTAQNGISHTLYRIIDLRFFTRKCDSRVLLVCIIGIMTILIHKTNQKATNRFGTRKPENRIEVNHGQIFEKSRSERPKCKGSGRWVSDWSKTSKRDLGAREEQIPLFRIDSTDHSLFDGSIYQRKLSKHHWELSIPNILRKWRRNQLFSIKIDKTQWSKVSKASGECSPLFWILLPDSAVLTRCVSSHGR